RNEWPDPAKPKSEVVAELEHAANTLPGTAYGMTQPIQMRFNELIAGIRSDVGVKIFGDALELLAGIARQVEGAIRDISGAADVKTEQVAGLP
ncbi:efflux RND transporter permease subunit, partial [Acinetobacter baumannii]